MIHARRRLVARALDPLGRDLMAEEDRRRIQKCEGRGCTNLVLPEYDYCLLCSDNLRSWGHHVEGGVIQ